MIVDGALHAGTHHVFFDACKLSHRPCQFPRVSPVFRIISWASDNQVVHSALLTLNC